MEIDQPYRVTGRRILPDRTIQSFEEMFERLLYKGTGAGLGPTDNFTHYDLTRSGAVSFGATSGWFEFPGEFDECADPKIEFRVGEFEAVPLAD